MTRAERGALLALLVATAAVFVAEWVAVGQLGWTAEDHRWQAIFAERSWLAIWTEGANTYRPLCGSLLRAQDAAGWSATARLAASLSAHWLTVALLGVLVARLRGPTAGLLAFAIAGAWSSDVELSTFLGARCDTLALLAGVAGALAIHGGRAMRSRRDVALVFLAASCAALATLAKESGWLLPALWAPLTWHEGRWRPRALAPSLAVVLALVAVRLLVLPSVLGPYVESYALASPFMHVRRLGRVLGTLVIGDAVPDVHALLLMGAALFVAAAALVARRAKAPRSLLVMLAVAWLLVWASVSLKPASRAYGMPVLFLAAMLAVAWERGALGRIGAWLLVGFGVFQAGSSIASAHRWAEASRERAEAVAQLAEERVGEEALLVFAPRSRFRRCLLGPPVPGDLPGEGAALVYACDPQLNDHYDFASPASGPATLLTPGHLEEVDDCAWRFRLEGRACRPMRGTREGVTFESDAGAVQVSLEGGHAVRARWLEDGQMQRRTLRCE